MTNATLLFWVIIILFTIICNYVMIKENINRSLALYDREMTTGFVLAINLVWFVYFCVKYKWYSSFPDWLNSFPQLIK